MANIIFEIRGEPVAKARHKASRRGKFITMYDPQEKVKQDTAWIAQQIAKDKLPDGILAGALSLEIQAYFSIPKSTSKKKRDAMLHGEIKHTKKPDADNIAKFYQDAFNGILWYDDSQIWALTVYKGYSNIPRTEIEITSEVLNAKD